MGIAPADTGAGVVAAVVAPAGPVGRTVGIDGTLRLALHIRVALGVGRAGAFAVIAYTARRQSAPAAGAGIAGVRNNRLG